MPTTSFVQPTDANGQPLNVIYAEHIIQFAKVFSALLDGGTLGLLGPVATPTVAPSITLAAGGLSGNYQWGFYWITGVPDGTGNVVVNGRTAPSTYTTAQTLASQEGTVSISGVTVPTGVVGWGTVRNKAGGSNWYVVPGSELFVNNSGALPTSFTDNVADTSLVTVAPSANTTGSTWAESTRLGNREMLPNYDQFVDPSSVDSNGFYTILNIKRPDGTLYMKSTLSNPDANGNYQTDTWQFYDVAGTTMILTHVWAITWDSSGKKTQAVMTS